MYFLYNLLAVMAGVVVKMLAWFSPKMKLFVEGRRQVAEVLREKISPADRVVWFHAASLGEYEQGLPVMEAFRNEYPQFKILLTFFSPSGYEIRKNTPAADVTVYLPMDSRGNVRAFLDAAHPEIAIFIKYEYWPNYLRELRRRKVETYLISGILRPGQVFFKWYGGFYRRGLSTFTHFFLQNEASALLMRKLGYTNITVSGDTRFDRVASILERDNTLDFVESFKDGKQLVVIGSSWPKDEAMMASFINRSGHPAKYIFAPHNIKEEQLAQLMIRLTKKVLRYSKMQGSQLSDFDVLIVDTIGMLTRIYSYADIAYVGGGFGNPGVHNILEPATFGVPVVIGPNYSHFAEARALVAKGGCIPVKDQQSLDAVMLRFLSDGQERAETGAICSDFVQQNRFATKIMMDFLRRRRNL